jgi:hypothetical protein
MGPLSDAEMTQRLGASAQIRKYAEDVDRESARERLAARVTGVDAVRVPPGPVPAPSPEGSRGAPKPPPSAFDKILKSPVVRSVAGQLTRGILGALMGSARRRSSW